MNDAKREIAKLLASVVDVPAGADDAEVTFEGWDLTSIQQSPQWTAIAFVAHGGTDWRSFDRDLTVAPSTGTITVEYEDDTAEAAMPDAPVLVGKNRTARYSPIDRATGILLFIPPILNPDEENG